MWALGFWELLRSPLRSKSKSQGAESHGTISALIRGDERYRRSSVEVVQIAQMGWIELQKKEKLILNTLKFGIRDYAINSNAISI
jgi:hypothetical protein